MRINKSENKIERSFIIALLLVAAGSFFSSCKEEEKQPGTSHVESPAAAEHHEEEVHEIANRASLTTAQVNSIGIELGKIEMKQLTASVRASGVLKVPNQNRATVNSIYSGVVRTIMVQPGLLVKKGQALATIANPDFIQAQSEFLNANSKISLAELEVKRQKELNAGNAGALKNLQAAETELRTLRTLRSTYGQQIQLMGINPESLQNGKLVSVLTVKSPIAGVVSDVNVKIGSYVDVSTAIAEIVDNSQLHLDLFVYEKDLSKLKNNQAIHFTVTNNPGKEYDAQIFSLGSSFEGQSKAISVHAKVEGDKSGLIDGMNVTAVISLDQVTVPAVPNDAIVNVDGQDYIFVKVDKDSDRKHQVDSLENLRTAQDSTGGYDFERIPVAKGTSNVGYTEINLLKDIPKDAEIVVKGAFFVSAKMTNTEGHAH